MNTIYPIFANNTCYITVSAKMPAMSVGFGDRFSINYKIVRNMKQLKLDKKNFYFIYTKLSDGIWGRFPALRRCDTTKCSHIS